jgi:sugar transferase (PEP-CTERM system associated)
LGKFDVSSLQLNRNAGGKVEEVVGTLAVEDMRARKTVDVRGVAAAPTLRLASAPADDAGALPFIQRPARRRSRFRHAAGLIRRVLIFGSGEKALRMRKLLLSSDCSAQVVGFYASVRDNALHVANVPVVSVGTMSLLEAARLLRVDEIVVAVGDRRGGVLPLRELLDCKLNGIRVFDMSSHYEHHLGQILLDSLNASWLIFGNGFRQDLARRLVKRAFDIVCSVTLLLLSLPIMLLAALAIAWESGLPILYRQERIGHNNRSFHVIKFRSMRIDAEKDGCPQWASSNDSRVTRVGKIIRKLRIDELPQLISVLKGDMSLVGPRPERPFFVEQLTAEVPFYAVRHSLKPGLTGWAQVRYSYGACKDDAVRKLQYDLYYVKNHSLLLDLKILFSTIGVVLTGKGAQ